MNYNLNQQLPVMETFYTLQGEGFHTGKAAYFIRLAGCDVGCVWCDVKESWDEAAHPMVTVAELVQRVKNHPGCLVVITGGEPLIHSLDNLCGAIQAAGFPVHYETSGTREMSGNPDWVCFSPKKFKAPLVANFPLTNELKVVIFHPSDFAWAESYAANMPAQCRLYLQPEWSKEAQITPRIIEYIKAHPKWQLSLQTHKYLNIE